MKCDLNWLSEWVAELPPAEELAQSLTMAGLEVDNHHDQVLELELTPNRGDCLSMRGLAREVSALTGAELQEPSEPKISADASADKPGLGEIEADACPYYSLRLIEGIDPGGRDAEMDTGPPRTLRCPGTPLAGRRHQLRHAGTGSAAACL